jgi:hypothetical protein
MKKYEKYDKYVKSYLDFEKQFRKLAKDYTPIITRKQYRHFSYRLLYKATILATIIGTIQSAFIIKEVRKDK